MHRNAFFFLTVFVIMCKAASSQGRFEISVTAKLPAKHLELLYIKKDSSFKVDRKTVEISADGKFLFSGQLPYPYAGYLLTDDRVRSSMFFIDSGRSEILIDSNKKDISIKGSKTSDEYYNKYKQAFLLIDKQIEFAIDQINIHDTIHNDVAGNAIEASLKKNLSRLKEKKRNIFYRYVKEHPRSYVAFWNLYFNVNNIGYQPAFDSAYQMLAGSLKNTVIGTEIQQLLSAGLSLTVGKKFPEIKFADENNAKKSIPLGDFTLVDFWFVDCAPCRRQFPILKTLYKEFGNRGFQIVSISIDKNYAYWKEGIRTNELTWPNFLDKGGGQSTGMAINSFPTNFLLDNAGNIIRKNIELTELRAFLKERVKK